MFIILAQYLGEGWQILEPTFEAQCAKAEQLDDHSEVLPALTVDLPAVIAVFEAMLCLDR